VPADQGGMVRTRKTYLFPVARPFLEIFEDSLKTPAAAFATLRLITDL